MSISSATTLHSDVELTDISKQKTARLSGDSGTANARTLDICTTNDTVAHVRAEAALRRLSHCTSAVLLDDLERDQWPCTSSSFVPGVHDGQSHQAITSNAENFSSKDDFEVYRIRDGVCSIHVDLEPYREAVYNDVRVLFCTLSNVPHSTFGRRLSMKGETLRALLEICQLPPKFALLLLGDSDHSAPGGSSMIEADGEESIDFFCAHPRWTVQTQDIPTSVCMRWDSRHNITDYVIVSAEGQNVCSTIKRMLSQMFPPNGAPALMHLHDPFSIHALIADELYFEAENVARHLRYRLYGALDKVGAFSHSSKHSLKTDGESSREDPTALTLELHEISQDLDLMLANGDMALRLNAAMQTMHTRLEAQIKNRVDTEVVVRDAASKMADMIRYNAACLEHQKRWLRSCASRKETAMSLVYHLIVQQDTVTTVAIARQAKDDGEAMKTIAVVTMLFLPGTFLGTVFSMNSIGDVHWWIYAVLTVGLTFLVVLAWASWRRVVKLIQERRKGRRRASDA